MHRGKNKSQMVFDFKEKAWNTVKTKVYFMCQSPDSAKHVKKNFKHSELWWQLLNLVAFTAVLLASQKSQQNRTLAHKPANKNTALLLLFHILTQCFSHSLYYS